MALAEKAKSAQDCKPVRSLDDAGYAFVSMVAKFKNPEACQGSYRKAAAKPPLTGLRILTKRKPWKQWRRPTKRAPA